MAGKTKIFIRIIIILLSIPIGLLFYKIPSLIIDVFNFEEGADIQTIKLGTGIFGGTLTYIILCLKILKSPI